MNVSENSEKTHWIEKTRAQSWLAAFVLLSATALGGWFHREQFFISYLVGYVYWLGMGLGALSLLLLAQLTGGLWAETLEPYLESAARTIFLLAILFLPIYFGAHYLYPWLNHEFVEHHELVGHKLLYLNWNFFTARAVFYFAVWGVLSVLLGRFLAAKRRGEESATARLSALGAVGLILYFLTLTFASTDWVMSLEPEWFSSIYGVFFIVEGGLGALALLTLTALYRNTNEDGQCTMNLTAMHDLGNLVFALTFFWGYIMLSQFLIIWSANLPHEISWYLSRSVSGWNKVSVILLAIHLVLPFGYLLLRGNKRSAKKLKPILFWMLAALYLFYLWLVVPGVRPQARLNWMDLTAWAGIGGAWLATYFGNLRKMQ